MNQHASVSGRRTSFAVVILALVCGVGCGAAGDAAPASSDGPVAAHDGLTITESNIELGKLVAVFRKDGREVTFDLRLGPKLPEESADPETPSSEIDARVFDKNGSELYMQMGGDTFIDKTWRQPKVENIDVAGRTADFELARASVSAFRAATVPAELEQLRIGAIAIGKTLAHTSLTDTSGKTTQSVPTTGGDPLNAASGVNIISYSSADVWDYQIYKKGAYASWSPVADHSAVMLRAWDSAKVPYTLLATWASCNHGACAGGSGWISTCNYSGWLNDDGSHSRYFYSEPRNGGDTALSGGCQTSYSVLTSGHHDCNDDSILQRKAIETDAYQPTTSGAICAGSPSLYAPGCH